MNVNREIAEKVMGFQEGNSSLGKFWKRFNPDGSWVVQPYDFDPMHRIEHAWMVVEKLAIDYHWRFTTPFINGEPYFAGLTPLGVTGWNGIPDIQKAGDTMMEAICLAALAAKESQ